MIKKLSKMSSSNSEIEKSVEILEEVVLSTQVSVQNLANSSEQDTDEIMTAIGDLASEVKRMNVNITNLSDKVDMIEQMQKSVDDKWLELMTGLISGVKSRGAVEKKKETTSSKEPSIRTTGTQRGGRRTTRQRGTRRKVKEVSGSSSRSESRSGSSDVSKEGSSSRSEESEDKRRDRGKRRRGTRGRDTTPVVKRGGRRGAGVGGNRRRGAGTSTKPVSRRR